jgi:low temperature requirement protein LtrA
VSTADDEVRVSTLELFFDLVFVFTITQLTALLAGMAAFFVISLTIPHAFGDDGVAFALAYMVVVAVHAGLYRGAAAWPTLRDVWRFARFNVAIALLILAGALIGSDAPEYALWLVAVLAILGSRLFSRPSDPIKPSHFIERHGLVVIVALGESVVAVGIGASGGDVDVELVAVAVLGLMLSACFWWIYFGDEARAERAFAATPIERRAALDRRLLLRPPADPARDRRGGRRARARHPPPGRRARPRARARAGDHPARHRRLRAAPAGRAGGRVRSLCGL